MNTNFKLSPTLKKGIVIISFLIAVALIVAIVKRHSTYDPIPQSIVFSADSAENEVSQHSRDSLKRYHHKSKKSKKSEATKKRESKKKKKKSDSKPLSSSPRNPIKDTIPSLR